MFRRKNVKQKSILAIFFVCVSSFSWAEQLSKIGIVDFSRVVENFPSGSAAFRKYDLLKSEYEERIQQYQLDLNEKELQLLDAKERGTDLEIARLQREVEDFKAFIRKWNETKLKEIDLARNELLEGAEIVQDILKAIEFIAVNEGYTIVFDVTDKDIVWHSMEIDITDLVIRRLRALAR